MQDSSFSNWQSIDDDDLDSNQEEFNVAEEAQETVSQTLIYMD